MKSFPLISSLKKVVKFIFLFSTIGLVFITFYKPPLPDENEVISQIKESEPVQNELPKGQKEIISKVGKYEYRLNPLFAYELNGLIVSDYNSENWLDIRHENDPGNIKDVCVVWGENIKNGSYKEVKFSSGEFTCFYRWDRTLEKEFYGNLLSNNHLIPQNSTIADKIRRSKVGDQIRIKGILADYSVYTDNQLVFTRKTSTTRGDTLNGACEIIYVTDYDVVRPNPLNFKNYAKVLGMASLTSMFTGILLFLFV